MPLIQILLGSWGVGGSRAEVSLEPVAKVAFSSEQPATTGAHLGVARSGLPCLQFNK